MATLPVWISSRTIRIDLTNGLFRHASSATTRTRAPTVASRTLSSATASRDSSASTGTRQFTASISSPCPA